VPIRGMYGGFLMRNEKGTLANLAHDYYLLQVDGRTKSTHRRFVDAVSAGLLIKQELPLCDVKVRNAADIRLEKTSAH